jgi:hypothetical protein
MVVAGAALFQRASRLGCFKRDRIHLGAGSGLGLVVGRWRPGAGCSSGPRHDAGAAGLVRSRKWR